MADFIGVSGSATYAVALPGVEDMLTILPDNTVNQIRAQDVRNVVYTLSQTIGGGGDFTYTQAAPLSQKSTQGVGGLPSGRTFSKVPYNEIFDAILFPAKGTDLVITTSPTSFEEGSPLVGNATVNVSVSITQNTFTVKSASLSDTSGLNGSYTTPNLPTGFGNTANTSVPYQNKQVTKNGTTTFTLNVTDDSGPISKPATVTYWYPRFYGYINLSGIVGFGADFQFSNTTTQTQKTNLLNLLRGSVEGGAGSWRNVWDSTSLNFTKFSKVSSPMSEVTVTPDPGLPAGSRVHHVLIWLTTDYSGGFPVDYILNDKPPAASPFVYLGETGVTLDFRNEYSIYKRMKVMIRDFSSSVSVKYKFNF